MDDERTVKLTVNDLHRAMDDYVLALFVLEGAGTSPRMEPVLREAHGALAGLRKRIADRVKSGV